MRRPPEALPAIRREGFGVRRASPELRLLSGPVVTAGGPTAATRRERRPTPDELRALLAAIGRQHLLLIDVEDAGTYRVADVAAPVFDASGNGALVVAVSGLDDVELRGTEVRALGAQVAATAEALTVAVRGQNPQHPVAGTA